MRTLGTEVARGRWGRSAVGRSQTRSLIADGVAVLVCCTPLGVAVSGRSEAADEKPERLMVRDERWAAAGSRVRRRGDRMDGGWFICF